LRNPLDAGPLVRALAAYREPKPVRSVVEIAITALPFAGLWALSWFVYAEGWWWALAVTTPAAAAFLVRLFMIQHDCGHGALFKNRLANDWIGRVIGVLTLTPYDYWRKTHAVHHGTSGNLDRRELGSIELLTVAEYERRSPWRRFLYRFYRHPAVLFLVGPAYMFILQHRLPIGLMKQGWRPWLSAMATNAAILAASALTMWATGVGAFFAVHLPILLIASGAGVWLFYVQHQFEATTWSREGEWNLQEAALHGSSHYDLPWLLRWFTANIGVHHVHHVNSRIPYYRLPEVLRDHPCLKAVGRVTLWQSLQCMRLALWDEASRRMISFHEFAQLRRLAPA
jgi:omega-6 fatty acid desaturase (delta-12 desaturase)